MAVDVEVSKIVVGGIWVNVYQRPEHASLPPAILFFIHGRKQSAEFYDPACRKLFTILDSLADGAKPAKNLIVVSLDQRNHGTRLIDSHLNDTWDLGDPVKHNENHAVDMYAVQMGTARDVSYLVDFLPAYLFPRGLPAGASGIQWLVTGISLGGHASWIVLRNDPRVQIGIPIIGCADYFKLMQFRAQQANVKLEPPIFSEHLGSVIAQYDPACAPHRGEVDNPFYNKKILILSGGKDQLVPFEPSREFVENLDVGKDGIKELIIEPGVGHEYTTAMQTSLCRFLWEHSLRT